MAMLLAAPRLDALRPRRRDPRTCVNTGVTRNLWSLANVKLIAAMIGIVALIAGLAYWDAARESAAALDQLGEREVTLAGALAALVARPAQAEPGPAAEADLLARLGSVERPRALAVLIHRPGEATLRATSGASIQSALLVDALARGASAVRIPREEAAAFGLPARTALAGIARVDGGALHRVGASDRGDRTAAGWDIVVIASAEHERDREIWARRRLVLSVLLAAGLVLIFGGLAMRNQRKELVLERELAVAAVAQRRDETLERASKAAVMGTLAMGVAHEISTPLGIIAARAEQMLPKLGSDERLAASVAAILAQADRIKQVIRGLLGLARGDAPSAERIEPRAVVDQAVGLVEHRFEKAGVRLTRAVAPELPAILGDPRLLEHAVVNLLLNACDACLPGDEVVVRATKPGAEVELVVEDPGSGISPADRERALEPFFTTKARGGGTGLGLAIAHEIVASHRGRLEFLPRRPRGTVAMIRLPPAEGFNDAVREA
jgi:two-component system, NtrC family, sensor kinase